MSKEIAELKEALGIMQKTDTVAPAVGSSFERKTDPCILVVRASALVTKLAATAAITPLMELNNFEEG
eukprot:413051-Pyramimonas_sp.AAC.1